MDDVNFSCPHCSQSLEAPTDMGGQKIQCPSCGKSIEVPLKPIVQAVYSPPPIEVRAISLPVNRLEPAQKIGKIKHKIEIIGIGGLVQLAGLALVFFFPIGTIGGVMMLIIGGRMSHKLTCGECGNKIADKDVKMCPVCSVRLEK